ncbi:hypothetical protein JMJ77_0001124 [Colletotrichum scovillei]|uniref:Uncharacterized protein n=1 Tax=Colletotrichum scovillei TaxID=1209932 RepID=A0A9P7RAY6_9PEZI|nr:hypothetical protein JMJ77_0001124 [Colletotrichum scovillei]KAG7072344.1 hypothetical protein JMJ76_0005200 [Colletotrichum scovillei]KAG7080590.1 hypothetical protein JMJ78_0007679 [Colletotrichum scovillei]
MEMAYSRGKGPLSSPARRKLAFETQYDLAVSSFVRPTRTRDVEAEEHKLTGSYAAQRNGFSLPIRTLFLGWRHTYTPSTNHHRRRRNYSLDDPGKQSLTQAGEAFAAG